jgi:hypothetical protein
MSGSYYAHDLQHQSMFETIFFMAELISVQPELQEEDLVISRSQIEKAEW